MKITVAICMYNAERTILASLESVLRQKLQPYEILIVDDGSTDNTLAMVDSYRTRVTILEQPHLGVSAARNKVCQQARGDFIAFLDSDDIWHPMYLDTHRALAAACPNSAAFFTGHVNFKGTADYNWTEPVPLEPLEFEAIPSDRFIELYNRCPSPFNSMSFCCVPTKCLRDLGPAPFPVEIGGVEDTYLLNTLPNLAPVVAYTPAPLVAYRISDSSLSADQLKTAGLIVNAFEILAQRRDSWFLRITPLKNFNMAFASWRRSYAKYLLGAGGFLSAREQLKRSVCVPNSLVSLAKSILLLLLTYLPGPIHPQWPSRWRQ